MNSELNKYVKKEWRQPTINVISKDELRQHIESSACSTYWICFIFDGR